MHRTRYPSYFVLNCRMRRRAPLDSKRLRELSATFLCQIRMESMFRIIVLVVAMGLGIARAQTFVSVR
jgi:hypothetical protein